MDSFSFNTSHVTLYRHSGMSWGLMKSSFNTSHVTLYQCNNLGRDCKYPVSIHLMLLFI